MFKGHSCKTIKHKAGYRSIHYIIPVNQIDGNKIACEIQTRTLFEEGWSEIDHRVRYPNFLDDENLKKYLDIFNRLAGSADEMGSYVNSLVDLINVNDELEQGIKLSEEKMEKLFKENAALSEIKIAYSELKNLYDEKEKIWNNSNSNENLTELEKRILRNISTNLDLNSLSIIGSRGSNITLIDKNGNRQILPEKYLPLLKNHIKRSINII